mgnify:CR=1 FL=1
MPFSSAISCRVLIVVLPIFLVGFIVAFISDYIQVKWKPTAKPLKPKFNKLDPVAGFKRMFGAQSLVELLKSILKIGLIVYVVYTTLRDQMEVIYLLFNMTLFDKYFGREGVSLYLIDMDY